jgi:predicted membrane-bound mannosyltransferase
VKTRALLVAFIFALAAYLRIPDLAARPMHADEAIYAYKLQTFLKTGAWSYDPGEYHGPVLHYVAAAPAGLFGLNEITLRMVPAVLGALLALMPLTLASAIGIAEAFAASALVAISPAMIYYSRYYIPEMLLTLLTAGAITVAYRYHRDQKLTWALIGGLVLGLMFATKETAVIAAASLLLARRKRPDSSHLLAASAAAAMAVILLLGPRETVQAMSSYVERAVQGQRHLHPWYYYLLLLMRSEVVIVVLAIVGALISKQQFVRFIAIYTALMVFVYSCIPYKTPWCLLGFLYGMILLAGVGLVFVSRWKPVALVAVAIGVVQLFTADAETIYAYAGTSRDVYAIREQLQRFRDRPIQVISAQNVWPLPWYLRDFPQVEWRRAVTGDMRPAPVILATPDVEPALLHQLYEVLPPGQRPLYVDLFGRRTELRSGVELRGYVQQSALSE